MKKLAKILIMLIMIISCATVLGACAETETPPEEPTPPTSMSGTGHQWR